MGFLAMFWCELVLYKFLICIDTEEFSDFGFIAMGEQLVFNRFCRSRELVPARPGDSRLAARALIGGRTWTLLEPTWLLIADILL